MAVKSVRNPKRNSRATSVAESSDLLMEGQDLLNPFTVGSWTPPVDICQTENRFLVRIELPGIEPSDMKLIFQGDTLRIRGSKREKGKLPKLLCYYCLERRYGRFDREITIKGIVNPRQSRAFLDKGILTVEIPKLKNRRGEAVEIQIDRK